MLNSFINKAKKSKTYGKFLKKNNVTKKSVT